MKARSIDELNEQLERVDAELYKLMAMRNKIIYELEIAKEAKAMQERGKKFNDILRKAMTFTDPAMTLIYVGQYVLPWRHYLIKQYFPYTLEAIPESTPSNWNRMEASILLLEISEALKRDRAAMFSGSE
jgi:hypothetical protein